MVYDCSKFYIILPQVWTSFLIRAYQNMVISEVRWKCEVQKGSIKWLFKYCVTLDALGFCLVRKPEHIPTKNSCLTWCLNGPYTLNHQKNRLWSHFRKIQRKNCSSNSEKTTFSVIKTSIRIALWRWQPIIVRSYHKMCKNTQ